MTKANLSSTKANLSSPEPLDSPDLIPVPDGLEDSWGSGHVAGPFDAEEMALLEALADAEEEG